MNWRTGRPPEDGWYWMEYDGGRKRIERYWVGDKNNYQNYAELVGWLGPLRPEDAEELERLRATVVAKEKTLRHYEEQIAEDTQRIVELEAKLATAREENERLREGLERLIAMRRKLSGNYIHDFSF